jgi:hypothetical protein
LHGHFSNQKAKTTIGINQIAHYANQIALKMLFYFFTIPQGLLMLARTQVQHTKKLDLPKGIKYLVKTYYRQNILRHGIFVKTNPLVH